MRRRFRKLCLELLESRKNPAVYNPGFVWNRQADWTPGTTAGTTTGNPDGDSQGVGTWSYENVSGGGLGSANPWFAAASSKLVWDNQWTSLTVGGWAKANDTPGVALQSAISHATGAYANNIPLVRWTNPTGQWAMLNISGNIQIDWGAGASGPVDVALVQRTSTGNSVLLYATTVNSSAGASQTLGVNLSGVLVGAGESIVFSIRSQAASGWVNATDNLNYTLAADYAAGFTWNRTTDWTIRPNSDAGTTNGNADDDAKGRGVWRYEAVANGGARGEANVWYKQTPHLLKWDTAWFGQPGGAWDEGDDIATVFQNTGFSHVPTANSAPLVRWVNPTRRDIAIDISGTLNLAWYGASGVNDLNDNMEGDIELVLMLQKKDGTQTPLRLFTRNSANDEASITVDVKQVAVGADDTIFLSARYRPALNSPLTPTVVADPAAGWTWISDNLTYKLSALNPGPLTAADAVVVNKNDQTNSNHDVNIEVLKNDRWDPQTLPKVTILAAPGKGTYAIEKDQSITYKPNLGEMGIDSFTYTVNDGTTTSAATTVNITINDPYVLYVKPTGNDANSGLSLGAALATLEGARNKIRALGGVAGVGKAIEVRFDDGVYRLTSTVTLGDSPLDSGTAALPITYMAIKDASTYTKGFSWNRQDDWTGGGIANSSIDNPDDDDAGKAAWRYVNFQRGATGTVAATEWYKTTRTSMKWDPSWFGFDQAWVQSDDVAGAASRTWMTAYVGTSASLSTPGTVWTNPTERTVTLKVGGTLTAYLDSSVAVAGQAGGVGVDLRIDKVTTGGVWSNVFNKTLSYSAAPQTVAVPNTSVEVNAGDSLVFSFRPKDGASGWIAVYDNLRYTINDVYGAGFQWNRQSDWSGGATDGTTAYNPDDDAAGIPTWKYVNFARGSTNTAASTWYTGPQTQMVWDSAWSGGSEAAWVQSNDVLGAASRNWLAAAVSSNSSISTPGYVWTNPTGKQQTLSVGGSFTAYLNQSVLTTGQPTGVGLDFKIIKLPATGAASTVYSTTIAYSASPVAVTIPAGTNVTVNAGDSIIVSMRPRNGASGYVMVYDNLTYTLTTTNAAPINPPPPATLSGGQALNLTWQQQAATPGVWWANVTDPAFIGVDFNSLFVNGQRATRAREPDVGYYRIVSVEGATRKSTFKFGDTDNNGAQDILSTWTNLDKVEIVNLSRWMETRERVLSVNTSTNEVTVKGDTEAGVFWAGYGSDYGIYQESETGTRVADGTVRYFVENVLEGLDTPGEWYFDSVLRRLYYMPRVGETLKTATSPANTIAAEFTAPVVKQLLQLNGLANVNFVGLTFRESDWQMTDAGVGGYLGAAQRNSYLQVINPNNAAVVASTTSQNLVFDKSLFVGNGYYAAQLLGTGQSIVRGEMRDNGGGGALIGRYIDDFSSPVNADENHRIALNRIHDNNKVWQEAIGLLATNTGNNRIAGNEVFNTTTIGIQIGSTLSSNTTNSKNNQIVWNNIHHFGRVLYDGGGIYMEGYQPGTVVMGNTVHDAFYTNAHLTTAFPGPIAIYNDMGSSGILVKGNVVYDVSVGHLNNINRDNYITSNTFVDVVQTVFYNFVNTRYAVTTNGVTTWYAYPKTGESQYESNVVAWTRPVVGVKFMYDFGVEGRAYSFDRNVYYVPAGVVFQAGYSIADQHTANHDNFSETVTDALFADAANRDYRIKKTRPDGSTSRPVALGFRAAWRLV